MSAVGVVVLFTTGLVIGWVAGAAWQEKLDVRRAAALRQALREAGRR